MTKYWLIALLLYSGTLPGKEPGSPDREKTLPNQVEPCEGNPFMDPGYIQAFLDSSKLEVPMEYNPRIFGFIDYFVNRDPGYTQMVINRSTKYFPYLEASFAETKTPDELKYLAIIESGLHPQARSRMGAGGMWQFMPYTGKTFGLRIDNLIDDRYDPYASTIAASQYLRQLREMLGSWDLAIAAYNCGPGNVRRAIRRSGYQRNFWEIFNYLPRETRSYMPQYVAMYYIFNHIEELGFHLNELEYLPQFQEITVNQNLDLERFASELGLCIEDLEALNPQIKQRIIPIQRKDYEFRIPTDAFQAFASNQDSILKRCGEMGPEQMRIIANYDRTDPYGKELHMYTVKSGDVLGIIAEKYHVRVSDLRTWNNLNGNTIRVGQRLKIYKAPGYQVRTYTPPPKPKEPQDIPSDKIHVVKYGDTLWDISRMYKGLSIERLKELNNLKDNKITPGQKLRIG